jgi:tetratricopeptide (TPR) repeat protein
MLDGLADVVREASLLVTFNGRTFDVPLMETRWAFHRRTAPTDDVPHFDMLPPARRLWGGREEAADRSCSLLALERVVLGFHRHGDVPGFEIPVRYFHFLRTGEARAVDDVLEHNRHDLLSLAVLTAHALWLAREGPDACRTEAEQAALGRLYERAGDASRARAAYERASASLVPGVRRRALARLATILGRAGEHHEAAGAWREILAAAPGAGSRRFDAIERRAAEALAIHHEHRAGDLASAKAYAETLRDGAAGGQAGIAHRLARLDRKIRRSGSLLGS